MFTLHFQIFRTGDRRRVEAKIFTELSITKEDFEKLPRPMQQAAWKGKLGGETLDITQQIKGGPLDTVLSTPSSLAQMGLPGSKSWGTESPVDGRLMIHPRWGHTGSASTSLPLQQCPRCFSATWGLTSSGCSLR